MARPDKPVGVEHPRLGVHCLGKRLGTGGDVDDGFGTDRDVEGFVTDGCRQAVCRFRNRRWRLGRDRDSRHLRR